MEKLTSYLTFKLANENFAANIANVLHILGVPKITPLPNAPAHIKGAINLRGQILTVIDPHFRFDMPEQELTKNSCIVVLEIEQDGETHEVGTIIDSVGKVIDIPDEQLLPPPDLGSKYKSDYIQNIIKRDEEFILVINISKMFSVSNDY